MRRLIEFGNYNVQTEGLYKDINIADDFDDDKTSSQIQQEEELERMLSSNPEFMDQEESMQVFESDEGDTDIKDIKDIEKANKTYDEDEFIDPDEGGELGVWLILFFE